MGCSWAYLILDVGGESQPVFVIEMLRVVMRRLLGAHVVDRPETKERDKLSAIQSAERC